MAEIFKSLLEIASTSIKVGWPLLILAFGLAGVAYFGGKDRIRTMAGWALVIVGLIFFVWNLRR
ncbi:MAG: hypothetical protein HY882_09160 [Deltaproteobacteria bacterium]|nr:hypothetical protein [Deltaproteobacteria bacterium]